MTTDAVATVHTMRLLRELVEEANRLEEEAEAHPRRSYRGDSEAIDCIKAQRRGVVFAAERLAGMLGCTLDWWSDPVIVVQRTIEELIEASSLGTPEAKAARASVSDEQVADVMRRLKIAPVDVATVRGILRRPE